MGLKAFAAVLACTAGFIAYLWVAEGVGPGAEPHAQAGVFTTASVVTAAHTSIHNKGIASSIASEATPVPSFADRFALDRTASSAGSTASFTDRFGGEVLASRAPVQSAAARTTVASAATPRETARSAGTKTAAAKNAVTKAAVAKGTAKTAPKQAAPSGFQLASVPDTSGALAYAPANAAASDGMPSVLRDLPAAGSTDPFADLDPARTAIYDISAGTVYLPNGRRLEAHSGLGRHMDDPRSSKIKNAGVTPPNVYDLRLREARFHGVRAIRLIPRDNARMHGRNGILAHTYMLGPSGQSNGCVSFKNYQAFLDAYDRGEITRIVVVERLAGAPPSPKTAADWFSNTLASLMPRT